MVPNDQRPGKRGGEAKSQPPAGDTTNPSTSAEQRVPDRITTVGAGPELHENGSYLAARYKTVERQREVAPSVFIKLEPNIREDR